MPDPLSEKIASIAAKRRPLVAGFSPCIQSLIDAGAAETARQIAGAENATERGVRYIRHGLSPDRATLLDRALPGRDAHLLPRADVIAQLERKLAHLVRKRGTWPAEANLETTVRQVLAAEREAAVNDAITAADGARDLMREARAA